MVFLAAHIQEVLANCNDFQHIVIGFQAKIQEQMLLISKLIRSVTNKNELCIALEYLRNFPDYQRDLINSLHPKQIDIKQLMKTSSIVAEILSHISDGQSKARLMKLWGDDIVTMIQNGHELNKIVYELKKTSPELVVALLMKLITLWGEEECKQRYGMNLVDGLVSQEIPVDTKSDCIRTLLKGPLPDLYEENPSKLNEFLKLYISTLTIFDIQSIGKRQSGRLH